MRALPVLVLVLLAVLAPAGAMGQSPGSGSVIQDAAAALREGPVHQAPGAPRTLGDDEVRRVLDAAETSGAGPFFVALLPAGARGEVGGSADAVLAALVQATGRPGTYAAFIGDALRARSTDVGDDRANTLAQAALVAQRTEGTAAVLEDLARRVGQARAELQPRDGDDTGPQGPSSETGTDGLLALLAALVVLGVVAYVLVRARRRGAGEGGEDVRPPS